MELRSRKNRIEIPASLSQPAVILHVPAAFRPSDLKLLRLIKRHVGAQIELAFKGCTDPEDWDAIETNAKESKRKLMMFIQEITHDD